jgi:hypothetical protein
MAAEDGPRLGQQGSSQNQFSNLEPSVRARRGERRFASHVVHSASREHGRDQGVF